MADQNLVETFTGIADAIREKDGTTDDIPVSDMPERIRMLNGGGYNVTNARLGEVVLPASAWTGSDGLYSQVVSIDGVTDRSQVDLTPSVEQLVVFHDKDLTFVTENDAGVVTVYAIGQKPTNDYTIQVTITEVIL